MKHVRGFTIVELMVTVLILAIITAIAAPSFSNIMRGSSINSSLLQLRSAFALAREQAVTMQENVTICTSTDGLTCTGNNDWESGWIVFTDEDGAGDFDDDGDLIPCEDGQDDDCVLRMWEGVADKQIIITEDTGPDRTFVRYQSDGSIIAAADAVHLTIVPVDCPNGMRDQRELEVNAVGRYETTSELCP